ncbi:MAG: outer membrane protein beta-barrel protein [Mucilaginibacter sp.]|nr:outer membrane protein beta-barrel protein [Mucilaginibacter sp.]
MPLSQKNIQFKNAITLNTGAEYRPKEENALFYRFNYDAASKKYRKNIAGIVPGNVVNGTAHQSYFVMGAGYRLRHQHMGYYFLLQPGLATHSFDKVSGNAGEFTISQVSVSNFTVKYSAGIEYYLAQHFALIFEPAVYQNSFKSIKPYNPSQVSINIGFTTTLF